MTNAVNSGNALRRLIVCLPAFWPSNSYAHLFGATHSETFDPWDFDPLALFLLVAVAVVYLRGHRILRNKKGLDQKVASIRSKQFWTGWLTLVVALVSPLDPLGEHLFTAHMIQHELLMLVAGPLLIASRPGSAIVLGARPILVPLVQSLTGRNSVVTRGFGVLLSLSIAWVVHFIGLWAWHIPSLFNASLTNSWLHSAQHICFMIIALIFWHSILRSSNDQSIQVVVSLFTTALHASALGALLTFSPVIWYEDYGMRTQVWGLTPLEDQQLGGLIMWMPAGLIFVAIALIKLGRCLNAEKQSAQAKAKFADYTGEDAASPTE